ncbi:MAG: circularly permuted type 2 ATP-grasp protein, partial [Bacteriovoracaceae bacterium]|nr:circularly permuted type 2 ATP-grasp protein [Bacteriovoracaceae bacterium]
YDPSKGLYLRDQDTGEPIFLRDVLKLGEDGKAPIIRDYKGNKVPLQSAYAIPGAIEAITSGKLYMGGLNRIMDNKIILATLTHYAPKFFAKEIESYGLDSSGTKIMPPQTLPPTKESADIIANNPDEWVVKAPSLAGGQGVYILKTLNKARKQEIIDMIQKNPKEFAYQQLVKIARIPVAVQRKAEGFKFANLAADIRMWVFFGAGKGNKPRISHNALVRYAPQEKGAMSSIVNTSAGGGYAPFVIMDDTNDKNAVSAKELVTPKVPVPHTSALPIFVSASFVQIARMLNEANRMLAKEVTTANEVLGLIVGLKLQLKEVLSFLHPRGIENIYKIIDLLESKIDKSNVASYYRTIAQGQLKVVELIKANENKLSKNFLDMLENIRALSIDTVNGNYTHAQKALDSVLLEELKSLDSKENAAELLEVLESMINLESRRYILKARTKNIIISLLNNFCKSSIERLNASDATREFSALFSLKNEATRLKFETLYLGEKDADKEIKIATQFEMRNDVLLTESAYIPTHLQTARKEWITILKEAKKLKKDEGAKFIARKRKAHFKKHPYLARYQSIINNENASIDELIELLPTAPYAKFNIENFAKEQGLTVKEIFSSNLKKNRISVLSDRQLALNKLRSREFAGECFAKKNKSHGLYSDSDIFIWLRSGLNPFISIYTAGHEIVHYHQIKNSMAAEKRALKDGGVSIAKFINYYGNFLGANQRSVDAINFDMQPKRTPLYGYSDRNVIDFMNPIISELRSALNKNNEAWDKTLANYGSYFSYMMPNNAGTRVKALQEVIPALENAKNIRFAKELGLEINICEYKSALPIANDRQVKQYKSDIESAINSTQKNWESLRVIANHQYYGVSFYRADNEKENLTVTPIVSTVNVGSSYNQTQQ